jgi:hypothetical protein
MNIVNVYHGRDAYDFAKGYHLNNTYYELTDDDVVDLCKKQAGYLKRDVICMYIISVLTIVEGAEPTHAVWHGTNKEKKKIVLNARAKRTFTPRASIIDLAQIMPHFDFNQQEEAL